MPDSGVRALAPKLEDAWKRYAAGLEKLRDTLHAMEIAQTTADHVAADHWLLQAQAAAYNLVIAPNPQLPTFLVHNVFEPNVYNWLLPNADFLYRYAFLDGAGSFRIRGVRRNAHFLDAQVIRGFWGDADMAMFGSHSLDDFEISADGSFEIHVGPEAPARGEGKGAAWIRTDPEARKNTLLVREAFYDWTTERASDLRIEPTSYAGPGCFVPDESELVDRIDAALRMIEFCHRTFSGQLTADVVAAVGTNRFLHIDTSKDEDAANPAAGYVPAVYNLDEDEALILEFEVPRSSYWSLQLGDVWFQAADFVHHQSSLNGFQVERDPDGWARIVLSARDPGVPNWLDTAGNSRGVVLLRWYHAERYPVPEATRTALRDVSDALPPETPSISPEERRRRLALRREAVLRRYGN
jgi:hypothetical protein